MSKQSLIKNQARERLYGLRAGIHVLETQHITTEQNIIGYSNGQGSAIAMQKEKTSS